jgi:GTP-binding protein
MHMSGRGTDVRLERNDRIGATERKEARRIRRAGSDELEDDLDVEE